MAEPIVIVKENGLKVRVTIKPDQGEPNRFNDPSVISIGHNKWEFTWSDVPYDCRKAAWKKHDETDDENAEKVQVRFERR